jgi:hypothetical protein
VNGNTISGIGECDLILDGVDVVSSTRAERSFRRLSMPEFSVPQSPYSAELAERRASAHNETGTNRFHEEPASSSAARNWTRATILAAKTETQQFGAFSGPLSIPFLYSGKDKTFFFVDYEGQRLRRDWSSTARAYRLRSAWEISVPG